MGFGRLLAAARCVKLAVFGHMKASQRGERFVELAWLADDRSGDVAVNQTVGRGEPADLAAPTSSERTALAALAQKCLDAKGVGCEKWEEEINERVAALYGL